MSITANAIFITLFCRARGFTLYAPVSSSEKLTGARRGPGLHLTGLLNHFLLCVGLVTYLWTLSLFGFFQKQILTTNNVYGRYRKQSSIGKERQQIKTRTGASSCRRLWDKAAKLLLSIFLFKGGGAEVITHLPQGH